jgi:hypothetical protein
MRSRLCYVAYRVAEDLVSLVSRAINAFVCGGSTAQTLSARSYLEGRTSARWRRVGRVINALFFWEDNHIRDAWEREVARARHVLRRLDGLD